MNVQDSRILARLLSIRSGTAAMETSTAMNGFMEMMGSKVST